MCIESCVCVCTVWLTHASVMFAPLGVDYTPSLSNTGDVLGVFVKICHHQTFLRLSLFSHLNSFCQDPRAACPNWTPVSPGRNGFQRQPSGLRPELGLPVLQPVWPECRMGHRAGGLRCSRRHLLLRALHLAAGQRALPKKQETQELSGSPRLLPGLHSRPLLSHLCLHCGEGFFHLCLKEVSLWGAVRRLLRLPLDADCEAEHLCQEWRRAPGLGFVSGDAGAVAGGGDHQHRVAHHHSGAAPTGAP